MVQPEEIHSQKEAEYPEPFEVLLEHALKNYDGAKDRVSFSWQGLPEYITSNINDPLNVMKRMGLISQFWPDLGGCLIFLTPRGKNYFSDKEKGKYPKPIPTTTLNYFESGSNIVVNSGSIYGNVEQRIRNDGGDDTEALLALIEELKKESLEIKDTDKIPKPLFEKVLQYGQKYSWILKDILDIIRTLNNS